MTPCEEERLGQDHQRRESTRSPSSHLRKASLFHERSFYRIQVSTSFSKYPIFFTNTVVETIIQQTTKTSLLIQLERKKVYTFTNISSFHLVFQSLIHNLTVQLRYHGYCHLYSMSGVFIGFRFPHLFPNIQFSSPIPLWRR